MADKDDKKQGAAQQTASEGEPPTTQVGLLAQYVKDLSFENPNAPSALQEFSKDKPDIDISINVNAGKIGDEAYEVSLQVSVTAKIEAKTAFVIECEYAGLFGVRNMPDETLQPFLLIECPKLLFPFARRVIGDATRDGGFPPLLLDPIDFNEIYRSHVEKAQAQGGNGGTPADTTAST